MQNEESGFPSREKHSAKSCCLLVMTAVLVGFILILSAIACIIIVDTVSLRGEDYTLSRRVERYKVACQFLWVDFKTAVSRFSGSEVSEPQRIEHHVAPSESEPEP
jgi:hypothetical protein